MERGSIKCKIFVGNETDVKCGRREENKMLMNWMRRREKKGSCKALVVKIMQLFLIICQKSGKKSQGHAKQKERDWSP